MKISIFWFLLLIFILPACGSPPLIRPANTTSSPKTEVPSPSVAKAAGEIDGENFAASPILTPTKENPVSEATVTTPSQANPTPTPSPTPSIPPSPTPSKMVTAQTGRVTAGGYTFSLPQEVPDELGPVKIVGWLPDSPNEVVAIAGYQIIAIDVYTGQVREFSPAFDSPINPNLVRPLKNDRVLFIYYQPETVEPKGSVWLSGAGKEQTTAPILDESYLSPIVLADEEGAILYNTITNQISVPEGDQNALQRQSVIAAPLINLMTSEISGQGEKQPIYTLKSIASPDSRYLAVYSSQQFDLIELQRGESTPVYLRDHARAAYWSPDGRKLAMLVTEGPDPIPFMKLFVYDVETEQLREIETDFQYITNVTWAPDSKHLLISADTGVAQAESGYEYKTGNLFLIDLSSNELTLLPLIPEGSAINFIWDLSWNPDGQKIALSTVLSKPGNPQLYRIDVGIR